MLFLTKFKVKKERKQMLLPKSVGHKTKTSLPLKTAWITCCYSSFSFRC